MSRPHPRPGARLKASVIVPATADEHADGYAVFGPEDDVPEWAARKIGAHAWVDGKVPVADEAAPAADSDSDGHGDRQPGDEPARSGRGSGKDAWVAFAHETGHGDLVGDKSRDEIVQALIDTGVISG